MKKILIVALLFIGVGGSYLFYVRQTGITRQKECDAQGDKYVYLKKRGYCILKEQMLGPTSKGDCLKYSYYRYDEDRNKCVVKEDIRVIP